MSTGISRLQLLLERDADLGVHCYFDTLLHVPSYSTTETPKWYSYLLPHNGNVRAVKLRLGHGADVDTQPWSLRSPFHDMSLHGVRYASDSRSDRSGTTVSERPSVTRSTVHFCHLHSSSRLSPLPSPSRLDNRRRVTANKSFSFPLSQPPAFLSPSLFVSFIVL